MRRAAAWLVLGAATAALGRAFEVLGVPSAYLFAALVLGLVAALGAPGFFVMPGGPFLVAQAVTGVVIGTYLQSSSLGALGAAWLPVTLVTAATLLVSLAAGLILARCTEIDRPTAAMGMIAGGATGIVTMARELDGDERLVAFMQYARVLVVVLTTPALIALIFPGHHAAAVTTAGPPLLGTVAGWPLTFAVAAAGALLATRLRIPSAVLLGPMILAGALTLTGAVHALAVPPLLREICFAVIGLQVGLRFTVETLRQVGRLLVPVLLGILLIVVASAGLAVVLDATTSVSLLDAYLATTPGGLYAVVAVAFGAGADTTFIVAMQGLRVVVMVLLAPYVVRRMLRRPAAVGAG